jgi:HK97 family phage prohead protease
VTEQLTFGATAEVSGRTLTGVAHAFGTRTLVGNRYFEFAPSAFDEALKVSDVRAFWNHDTQLLLGSQHAGTVDVVAKPDGLHYRIEVPETTYADDMLALIKRGDLSSMSFGIFPGKVTTSKAPDGKQVVTHISVKSLFDISPVSMPAFATGTSIALHSASFGESVESQIIKARMRAAQKG